MLFFTCPSTMRIGTSLHAPDKIYYTVLHYQWEWMRILDAKGPLKIKEHSKVVDIFRPELDVVGLK